MQVKIVFIIKTNLIKEILHDIKWIQSEVDLNDTVLALCSSFLLLNTLLIGGALFTGGRGGRASRGVPRSYKNNSTQSIFLIRILV